MHRDSYIKALWDRIERDGLAPIVFDDGQVKDADSFLAMVKDGTKTIWFEIQVYGETIGMVWFNRLEKTHAYCHFLAFPEHWGRKDSVVIGREALKMITHYFPTIMGMIPTWNTHAIDWLKKVGLHESIVIPNLIWSASKDKAMEGMILYITAEDLE